MRLRLILKMVHPTLPLPALEHTSWMHMIWHPLKVSDGFSGPIVQAPSRRLISKGEQFCY